MDDDEEEEEEEDDDDDEERKGQTPTSIERSAKTQGHRTRQPAVGEHAR